MLKTILLGLLITGTSLAKDITFSLESIDKSLASVSSHAQSWPPKFESDAERQMFEGELKNVIALLDAAVSQNPDDAVLLSRHGLAHALGHNLDFPGSAEKAIHSYEHLLALHPDNPRANYDYGAFLCGTAVGGEKAIK